jgi:hypothetical protein
MARSRLINDILRRAAIREAGERDREQREAAFRATMQGLGAAIDHAAVKRRDDAELVHYHPSHEGERRLKTNWPRPTQRVLPAKHPVPAWRV